MRRPFAASPDHEDSAQSSATERATSWLANFGTLHPAVMQGSLTVGGANNERLLLVGPISTPIGIVIAVAPGSLMVTM